MREIKFKVFDKEKKRMSKVYHIGSPFIEWEDDVDMPTVFTYKNNRFVFCQFLGITDMDDNDIYEYDRVKVYDIYHIEGLPNPNDFTKHCNDNDIDCIKKGIEEYSKVDDEFWATDPEPTPLEIGEDIATMERFPVHWLKEEKFGYEGEELIHSKSTRVVGSSLLE